MIGQSSHDFSHGFDPSIVSQIGWSEVGLLLVNLSRSVKSLFGSFIYIMD